MWHQAKEILAHPSPPQTKISLMNLLLLRKPLLEKDSEEVRAIKEAIEEFISSPISRSQGYILLDVVTKVNPTVYIHNWGPIIISSLKSPDNSVSKELILGIVEHLVINFSGNSSLQDVFQRFIPEIISTLLKTPFYNEEATLSLNALAVFMQHLPAITSPFFEEIVVFLMGHMSSLDFKTEEGVAECFAVIPLCLQNKLRPKPSYSDAWLDSFLKILNTLQLVMNDFLQYHDVDGSCVEMEGLPLLPVPREEEEIDEYSQMFNRIKMFSSLCRCLSKMMSVHTDSSLQNLRVQVPVQDLLRCMERIFHIYDYLKETLDENYILNLGYPVMQTSALSVLESLIMNFTVIEQSANIVAILKKIILTTVSETNESWAWEVRSSTWKVADAWLKCYETISSQDIVNNKLFISELLKDIIPDQENGVSKISSKGNSVETREKCCREALNVLCSMFIFGGDCMDKVFINDISSTVLKVSCKVQQSSHPAKTFVYPYTNYNCRMNLYRCLSLVSMADPMQSKYARHAMHVFRSAAKDPHLEVRTVCSTALQSLRFYINPKKPLPEVMTTRVQEEAEPGGWEVGFHWTPPEEEEMDASPTAYPTNSLDAHPSSSPHYADGLDAAQCNGAPEQPSHSVGSDLNMSTHSNVDSESSEVKEYTIDEEEEEEPATKPGPLLVSLKPVQIPPPDASSNHRDFPEEVESRRANSENGVYAESEEDENSEEEDEEGSEEEEVEGRYSPISEENREYDQPERKRPRLDEEVSSEVEEYEEPPKVVATKVVEPEVPPQEEESVENRPPEVPMSPTMDEMCQDFVLVEPEEIR